MSYHDVSETPPHCQRPGCDQPVKLRGRTLASGWRKYCSVRCGASHAPRLTRQANGRRSGKLCRKRADAIRCAKAFELAATLVHRLESAGHLFTDFEKRWLTAGLVKTAREANKHGYFAGYFVGYEAGKKRADRDASAQQVTAA
jgi:hypothetical protein